VVAVVTFGSLFAGVGGFDLGFERAGLMCRFQVEIDPFCLAVLEKHWPNVQRFTDVRTVGAHNLERVDVLCGGFPCQDLSAAGNRIGLTGERSGLYVEFVRVIRELRPDWVVIENVHHAWRQWVPVLRRALWELGYASLPIRLRASDFGAWHERARTFVVAHADASVLRLESWRRGWPFWPESPLFADVAADGCGLSEPTIGHERGAGWRTDLARHAGPATTADADPVRELQPQGRESDQRRWTGDGCWWATEPDVVRVVHGVPSRLHGRRMAARVAALGNAVIPQEIEWIGRRLMEATA
jgi:site-specific DNA-cytosine methylase